MSPAIDAIKKLPTNLLSDADGTTQFKLFKPMADELDELAVAFADLQTILDIQAMAATNLDRLGELLNELRQGRDDATYRVFLGVAIQQLLSRGDIESINTIAEALGFTNINIIELYDSGLRWDGTRFLDTTTLLNGVDRPATFMFFQELNVDDVTGSFEISTSINAVRAGGVLAQISFDFTSNQSQGVLSSTWSSLLDATELMDGETAMRPDKMDLTPNKIALRDAGGEVLRKDVVTFVDGDGIPNHQIQVDEVELDGVTIITLQLYKDAVLMWTDTFAGKVKDDLTVMIFKMKETD